ncbi:uncharacterized protein L969DRAFT_45156 [Mixia osmundae IAM 14324]|uniref:Nucleotide-diphospho-sugar transferase domain-containing protein n=1 Tax=Mixia osmundae (strain CBS 9802 / IAM 14324 / JCM 22182 / KY 12970) TaxID=764103 RepID=G7DU07_MIXOS|nr:uncharacterized protein L969DRAFT_45156 [Mixia osmundae IAM 14324]KEI41780.1 hypothetical protein L969DRAFT_45156 [Mixia osmundae IAM 14324]GAA94067.1 hypothetical protein E5Q_00714 [Mixia osmundae IAM 14324]
MTYSRIRLELTPDNSFDDLERKSVVTKPTSHWLRRPFRFIALSLAACLALSAALALPSQDVRTRTRERLSIWSAQVVETAQGQSGWLYPSDLLSHTGLRQNEWSDQYRQAGHLGRYLLRREIPLDRTVFVIIADHTYVPAIRNFDSVLRLHGHDDAVVTLCLSVDCVDNLEEHGLIGYHGYLNQTVADIKLNSNIDLAKSGYNFVFADGDVYLNPAFDPLHGMLPLGNDTWDLQFSFERWGDQLNIGWYFVRASKYSVAYFESCLQSMMKKRVWDQAIFNTEYRRLRKEAEDTTGLDSFRIKILSCDNNLSWMQEHWQYTYGNASRMNDLIANATTIHFTCVEKSVKLLFAHIWGLWQDIDGYYSQPRPLLRLPLLTGTIDELRQQWTFARWLGKKTGRQVIFPEFVMLVNGTQTQRRTGYNTFYIESDDLLDSVVSSRYTEIRIQRGLPVLPEHKIAATADLRDAITRVDPQIVAWLPDLSLAAAKFALSSGTDMLPLCEYVARINGGGCLRVCGKPV